MIGEFAIGGVLAPTLLLWGVLALLVSLPVRRLLDWVGAYRFVWHRGLFDVALVLILWSLIAALAARLTFPA